MPTVSTTGLRAAPEVENAIAQHEAAMNRSRAIPSLVDLGMEELATKPVIWIYNVGPWNHNRWLGSAGRYHIAACPDDKDFIEAVALPERCPEIYPYDETSFRMVTPVETGRFRGEQILGIGAHAGGSSLIPFGVFLSDRNPPSKAEVDAAKKTLAAQYQKLVKEANDAYALGPERAKEIISPEFHFVAARKLKKTAIECRWLENTDAPEERKACFNCGTPYVVGISQCPSCRAILDKVKFDEYVKRGLLPGLA